MKRFILLMLALVFTTSIVHAQATLVGSEGFENSTHSFTSTPGSAWTVTNSFAYSGTKSIWAAVPNLTGDSVVLVTPVYDCSNYAFISMRFNHICKVSTMDQVQVQYRLNVVGAGGQWQDIPASAYEGSATNYSTTGFNASSYSIWNVNDSLVIPTNAWWKEEVFDLSNQASYDQVQFRFVIRKGNTTGTQINYGWLIDNFELYASNTEIKMPVVAFMAPFVQDTVYSTGPYAIKAKVATRTSAPIVTPYLKYTATLNNVVVANDSILMTATAGDSIWTATIPRFLQNTVVNYRIDGKDTAGNASSALSGYVIIRYAGGGGGSSWSLLGDTLAGTSTSDNYYAPYNGYYDYSWSRMLYKSSELPVGANKITGVAFYVTDDYNGTILNQSLYVQSVPDVVFNTNNYVDPVTNGATLAWSGSFTPIVGAWNYINFATPINLSIGNSLLLFWENRDGSYVDETYYLSTYENTNLVVAKWQDGSFPTTQGNYESYRPVCLANIMAGTAAANSASIAEILNPQDTVVALPNVPVKVVLHNNGGNNLASATIGWSLNGVVQTPYQFATDAAHPVYWDFDTVVTIGTFTPQINRYDTIVAWVTMPNGVLDTNTFDDTLTKVVFGAADLQYEWVDVPNDTVYSTGPYKLQLRVWSMSGNSTVSNLNMKYRYKDTTGTWLDSANVAMVNMGNNIWQAAIPNIRFNHHVEYSVAMTDYLNNVITTSGSYFIKIGGGGVGSITDSIIYGSQSTNNCADPWVVTGDGINHNVSVYLNSGLGNPTQPIVGLAYTPYTTMTTSFFRYHVQCYVKATTATTVSAYLDPIAEGATLVYDGDLNFSINGQPWCAVTFDRAYRLPAGQNLLVWWVDTSSLNSCSQNTTTIYWAHHSQTDGTYRDAHNYSSGCGGSNINSVYAAVPYTQFYFGTEKSKDSSNSVAIEEFASPTAGATTSGVQPVQVVIRNQGLIDLTSCIVGYSVDGVLQDTVHWTGLLPADFVDTIDFGTINILPNNIYELTAWVSTPNGVYDSAYYDDTLTISTIACTGAMTGVVRVDPSGNGDATSLSSALYAVKNCGMSGKLTLEMANGTYAEGIDLTSLANIMESTDTLEITSASGIADSVKFIGSVTLGENNNIYINHITIDGSAISDAVKLTKPCDNIEISNCIIKANTNSTSSSAIYYVGTSSSLPMGRLKILDNTIIGGYYGIQLRYLYPNSSAMVTGTGYATIKGNNLSEIGYYGLYLYYYSKYDYISDNIIATRCTSSAQYGMYMYYYDRVDSGITNNRIYLNGTSTKYGIYSYYLNNSGTGAAGNALIANNEIKNVGGAGTFYGMYVYYNRADYYHNTVLGKGTGTQYCLYVTSMSNTYSSVIKNNIFAAMGTGTNYPIYTGTASYVTQASGVTLDYNDYYAIGGTSYVGYIAGAVTSLTALQAATGQDVHSINVDPMFTDTSSDLEISNYVPLLVPNVGVNADINHASRFALSPMGAYTIDLPTTPSAAIEIVNWDDEYVKGASKAVEVKVTNLSQPSITSAIIGWSVNGVVQTPYNWSVQPGIASFDEAQTVIGNAIFTADSTTVTVWIDKLNVSYNNVQLDTASAKAKGVVLAEFVEPLVPDTLFGLSFNVFTKIQEGTGATITTPVMTTQATIGATTLRDTITMVLDHDNIWKAAIPQYYYGTNVVYTTTISDTLNNSVTLTGHTYLKAGIGMDSIEFTGTVTNYYTPLNLFYNYSWSRQIYLGRELEAQSRGGQITKLAWRYAYATSYTSTNQTCYMMAVDDSVITTTYMDPMSNPAMKKVWTGSITWQQGWCEITLDTAFDLPANKNLMVIWHNNNGSYPGSAYVFYHHNTTLTSTAYQYSDGGFPTSSGSSSTARPDAKFTIGSPFEPYNVKDLSISAMLSPVNGDELCSPDYSSATVILQNLSKQTHDFSTDSVTVFMEVTTPVQFTASVTLNSGQLEEGESDTLELSNMMPVMTPGQYDIKVWHNYGDSVIYDDTLINNFISSRLGLPMDETFRNGLPLSMRVDDNNTATGWEVMYDSNATGTVIPQTDNAMIAFDGSRGAMTRLFTRQLDLSGTSEPILDFWYWHDTAATASTMDYTDVRLTFDGGQTFTTLFSVRKNNGNDMGWTQYTYSLDSFVNQSCIILVFEAMRMSLPQFNGEQYIDRIKLTSNQDLSLESMYKPELTPCDYTGKELSIIMGSKTAQNINFESYPTTLQVNITGTITQSYNISLNTGIIPGLDYDTLVLDNNFDFNPGTYYVYAKILTSIDKVAANDVLRDTIIVNPSIDVAATQVTGGNDNTNCIGVGSPVNQVVTLENDGNMDMEDVILTLNVYDITGAKVQTIEDTLAGLFAVNQTTTYTFAEAYEVPADAMYNVEIVANPMCNASLTYTDVLTECVDQSDVEVTAFINPTDDETCSSVGENIKVKVRVSNNHPDEDIQGVVLNVVVSANNAQIASWTETLSDISSDSYIDFEFPQGFNVPAEADYTIVAYVNSIDTKADNDTLSMTKCTDLGLVEQTGDVMFLGQNIPNPANAQTVVNYQVPTEGTVVFTLTTVTGQVIYTTTQEVEAGRNSVEFNTENLAAGIYFYTMDFNGQRLTKKMTIRK